MKPSTDMTMGVTERLAYGVILGLMMKLVAAGWLDADMAPYIAGGIVAAIGSAWAWWINRPANILRSAAQVPDPNSPTGLTRIVASPELAAATPEAGNIVSSANNDVVRQ